MSTQELKVDKSKDSVQNFMKNAIKVGERAMKVMILEEKNIAGALCFDQLLKSIFAKFDQAFS